MPDYVIAISGAIGSGKSSLASKLVELLGADRVSFGDEVRRYALEHGEDPNDRATLQQLGQALVVSELGPFVQRVVDSAPGRGGAVRRPLIVEGVRHVEVLLELKQRLSPRTVHLVHIETPNSLRERRLMDKYVIERRLVARYDADITEAQVARILPQYAFTKVDGELPMSLQISQVERAIEQWTGHRMRELA